MKCAKRLKKIQYPRFNVESIIKQAQVNIIGNTGDYVIFDEFVKEVKRLAKHVPSIKINTISSDGFAKGVIDGKFEELPERKENLVGYLDGVPVYVI